VSAFFIFVFMKNIFLIFCVFVLIKLPAQDTLMPIIFLDDVVISEKNNGFSVEDFISIVKKDTTFYMGFKHLRYYTHDYRSELNIFDKKGYKIGSLIKKGTHYSNSKRAWVVNDSLFSKGKIFRHNGDYKYYTPEALDEVFFPKDTIDISLEMTSNKKSGESQNMRDAKTIGFSIGTDDVEQSKGGMSKKLAIFDIEMQQYYNYIIGETVYNNIECYTFTISSKNELSEKDKKKALVRNIVSFFDKRNFNVIHREYKFVYKNWFVDLDLNILVNMAYFNDKHIPTEVFYKGFWNILFFKPERVDFKLINTNYIVH